MTPLSQLPSDTSRRILEDGLRVCDKLSGHASDQVASVVSDMIVHVRSTYPSRYIEAAVFYLLQNVFAACRENGTTLTLEYLTETLVDEDNPLGATIQSAIFDESLRAYEAALDGGENADLNSFFPLLPEGSYYDEQGASLLQKYLVVYCRARTMESAPAELPTECWTQLSSEMRRRYSSGFTNTFSLPNAGTTIGTGYVLDEVVGVGGMAVVYRAMHRDGFRVALKLRRPDCQDRERFAREARDTVQLVDSLFVLVKDADLSPASPYQYYTMNLVDGGKTLLDLLEPTDSEATQIVSQFLSKASTQNDGAGSITLNHQQRIKLLVQAVIPVCDGLQRLHNAGYIHCDLKPSNILLSRKNGPLIADLGLAKALKDGQSPAEPFFGTPEYASPEQASGEPLSPRSDIYQLGAILYRGISGSPPFNRQTTTETLTATISEDVPQLTAVDRSIDRSLAAVCHKALSRAPAQRYTSAESLGQDLRRYLRGEPVSARGGFWWRQALYRCSRSYQTWTALVLLATLLISWRISWMSHETVEGSVASQNRYRHPKTAVPVDASLETRPDWPSPDYKDVIFLRSSILFDLSEWRPIPAGVDPGEAGRIEPCYFTRVVDLILKEQPQDPSKKVVFQYRTEGAGVEIMSSSHRYSVRGSDGRTLLGGATSPVLVREVEVDLTNEPRGREVRVVIHGVGWNGFQPKQGKTWAAFLAPEGLSVGEIAVQFAIRHKPQGMPSLLVFPRGKRQAAVAAGTQNFFAHPKDPYWVWRPDGILADHVYLMEWDWGLGPVDR